MTQTEIDSAIAKVICRILREKRPKDSEDGIKYYYLDIQPQCIANAVALITKDPVLAPITEIHLARNAFLSAGLPDDLLTDDAVGDFRNREFEPGRRLMLLGPPDIAREWETIRFMQRLDGGQVMEATASWVAEFAPNIVDEQRRGWWSKALEGLNELRFAELTQYAEYVLRIAQELGKGTPLSEALGMSLPALRLQRHIALFSINERVKNYRSQWQRKFNDHKRRTNCYLEKKDKSDVFLDNEALENALKAYEASAEYDAATADVFRDYVAADYGWTRTSDRIAEVDWPTFNAALIESIARERTKNLGLDTLKLFQEDNTLPDLTDAQQDYLAELTTARTKSEPGDDDRKFFKTYYRQLQASPTVFSRWEAFIMEKSIEDEDFFSGLARCLKTLRPRSAEKPWKLVVTAKAATKDLLQVYEAAATAFATRYRGIHAVLAKAVDFKGFEELMIYPELLPQWKQDKSKSKRLKGQRPSKASCQITFYVNISADKERKLKLIWRFNPKSVYANLRQDVERLAKASSPLACTEVVRETSGRRPIPLDLADTKSLQPAFGRMAGTLIPQADNLEPFLLSAKFGNAVASLERERHISPEQGEELRAEFSTLESDYRIALDAFLTKGVGADSEIAKAAEAFGAILQVAASSSLPDIVHAELLPIVLSISTVGVRSYGPDSQPTVVVPPWHPFRLLAILTKAKQFGALTEQICSSAHTLSDADGDLLFEDVREWLSHVYYPEVVCRLHGLQPKLLAISDHHGDYSVHEPPVKEPGVNSPTDSDPKDAAVQIARIVGSYLSLQPHERDNLSVVLFDCDSELLPEAVVDQIRRMNEDEEQDAMCQILLAHSDKGKLRVLYRTLSQRDESPDAFNSSEATRDFMARLRINIMVAENDHDVSKGGHPYDIVFAENAIARRAQLKWEEMEIDATDAVSVKPSAWSRRRPMRSGPVTSAIYLTAPRAPTAVWNYVRAVSYAIEPDQARTIPAGKCLVPCRVLAVHDEKVGALINRMHELGSWVVNYDELLHRQLLAQKGIRVIRYKQDSTQGKNLIISSRSKVEMLRNELGRLASKLLPDLDKDALSKLTSDIITEANSISGTLVLRAVRRRENSKELFGLVLSKHIVATVLQGNRRMGWFLLDDYANWLGEDEKQRGDILCLSPAYAENGSPVLDVVVTEAKFVDHDLVGKKAKESASQLKQSLLRLESGLNPDSHSLDREIWLARISDMIVDGMEMPGADGFDASEWRRKVRDGGCAISIRGFSHIFDNGPEVGNSDVLSSPLQDTRNGFQEIYSLAATRQVFSAFVKHESAARPQDPTIGASRRLVVPAEEPEAAIFRDSPPDSSDGNGGGGESGASGVRSTPLAPISPAFPTPSANLAAGECEEASGIVEALGTPPIEAIDGEVIIEWAKKTTTTCRKALLGYGLHAELVSDPILTPNSLLLKFKGTDKLTVEALEKKRGEMRTTHALDVIGIRPELGAVTIVISRPQRQKIFISEVWQRWQPAISEGGNNRIVVAVKEDDNQLLHLSPVPLPHTLVAGMTGSGKSVLLQNIVLGVAATNTPNQARIAIIDPKFSAQLKPFEKLPHIFCPIVNDQQPSLDLLGSLTTEMDKRNQRLSEADSSDIDEYIGAGHHDMARIWVIYDEYGDWIRDSDDYKKQAWALLDRLAMKARSSGIYLVLAAQRPDNTLFSMVLRSNLGNRLALLVADEGTSDVATGVKGLGADRLLGGGHLLAKAGDFKEPVYAQVPFVSPDEVRRAVKFIANLYQSSLHSNP